MYWQIQNCLLKTWEYYRTDPYDIGSEARAGWTSTKKAQIHAHVNTGMSSTVPILLHRMRQLDVLDHTDAPSWPWSWSRFKAAQEKAAQAETKSSGVDAESAEKLLPAEGERADQTLTPDAKLQKIAHDSEEDYKKVWRFRKYIDAAASPEKFTYDDEKQFLEKLKRLDKNIQDIMNALREGQYPETVSLWDTQAVFKDIFQQMLSGARSQNLFRDRRNEQMKYYQPIIINLILNLCTSATAPAASASSLLPARPPPTALHTLHPPSPASSASSALPSRL